jgi:hypothetical protein
VLSLLLILGSLFVQGRYNPRDDYWQLCSVKEVNYGYADRYESIRDVDFKNLTFYILDGAGKILSVKFREGKFHKEEHNCYATAQLEGVDYVGSGAIGQERAVVRFSYGGACASSCESAFIQVFELKEHGLVLTQIIEFGNRGEKAVWFDARKGALRIIAIHPCDDNAWPFKLEIQFRWDDRRFRQTSLKQIATPNK